MTQKLKLIGELK